MSFPFDFLLIEIRRLIQFESSGVLRNHLGCQYDHIDEGMYDNSPEFVQDALATNDLQGFRPRCRLPPERFEREPHTNTQEHRVSCSRVGPTV